MRIEKKRLAVNTAIVTMTTLMIRVIGIAFNAYLSGRIGASGVGLFQLMMSVYGMAVTLASAGMRMTATRLCSEAEAGGASVRHTVASCMRVGGLMGIAALALLFCLSDFSAGLLGHAETAYPLRLLTFALPFVAMSSTLGGYFTARRRMGVYGAVQFVEQLCRIGLTVLALAVLPDQSEYDLLAIAFGIVAAECVSFLCSFTLCLIDLRRVKTGRGKEGVLRRIARIALPDATGAWVRSALSTTEQLLIPGQLAKATPGGDALATYGLISGMAAPVIFLPVAPMSALAGMLVPELARMRVLGEGERIRRTILRALKLCAVYSAAAAAALFFFAEPIAQGVYKNDDAALYIRALAPLIPLFYTDSLTDQMLKSLDQQVYCMRLNTVDCVLRVLFVLVVLPVGGAAAYIALMYVSEAFNFALSLSKLLSIAKVDRNGKIKLLNMATE
jgi:stage V sporulation protein B